MTGDFQELEKESFWREHQDTLVRIRHDLVSGKKSRTKFSPAGGVRKRTPNGPVGVKSSNHPPYGKYRRTPSPYLPMLHPQTHEGKGNPVQNGNTRKSKFEVVPPLKPKLAFAKPTDDYDSWGEEDDEELEDEEEEESHPARGVRKKGKKGYKPQPYPSPMMLPPQVVYGAPFPVYYPPPPVATRKKQQAKKQEKKRGYKDIHQERRALASQSGIPVPKKNRQKKPGHQSLPIYAAPYPMMPPMTFMYPPTQEEEEDDDEEEDEMAKSALKHWKKHPLFASDFVDWFVEDCLDTELLPDCLIEILKEIQHMPYDHPLYVPSLYACEDLLSDHVSEMVMDIAREAIAEVAHDLLDEERLKRDPLEDFLTDLIEDAVMMGTRELVRKTVVEMAEDYMETEYATGMLYNMVDDYVQDIGGELLEETVFDIVAEDFIESEVIATEVKEESEVIARETIQHYDTKIMRKEFKEISQQARDKLADAVMMEYLMTVMSQQGKLWTEDDHYNKHLDDLILNTSLNQMFGVKKQKEKTLQCKPLHKLHEKVVSDVALDVFLQQLTKSLDEDLADVDEYERGVTDGNPHPFPLLVR